MKRVRDARPKVPPMPERERWKAEVVQLGRWRWELRISSGMLMVTRGDLGCPVAWGSRERAIRKATRIRDRQQRRDDLRDERERGAIRVP